jgi:hypothetical protein
MAIDVRNIIVGAANLFVSASNGADRPADFNVAFAAADSYTTTLRASSGSWREVGLTTEGMDISYEPNYGEVTVDQLLDVAKIFKQSLRVTLKTSLTEATLQNMELAFGTTGTTTYQASSTTLKLAAGSLGTEPVERSLIAVSQSAPEGGVWGTSSSATPGTQSTERVYLARRVVSMDTVGHGLKRDAVTTFPVTFRCLPDTASAYVGSEYGKVIDRLYTTFAAL